jgi:hypothetical protein
MVTSPQVSWLFFKAIRAALPVTLISKFAIKCPAEIRAR